MALVDQIENFCLEYCEYLDEDGYTTFTNQFAHLETITDISFQPSTPYQLADIVTIHRGSIRLCYHFLIRPEKVGQALIIDDNSGLPCLQLLLKQVLEQNLSCQLTKSASKTN